MDDDETLIYRLRERARIRRQIPERKSVQEGKPDRIADLFDEAADSASFMHRILSAVAFDNCDKIWWRVDGEYAPVTFFVDCSDVFYWGTSASEKITEDNIDILEQSFKDTEGDDGASGNILFCSRVRKMRPQGAWYTYIDKDQWHLFDACGPERDTDAGNPYNPGEYKLK